MLRPTSPCPAVPGSLCPDPALSVTLQPPIEILASRAPRRDLLTRGFCLPHAHLLSSLATRHLFTPSFEGPLTTVPKSFPCHRSEKFARNSFVCHTSEKPLPQVQSLPHIQDPREATSRPVISSAARNPSSFTFIRFSNFAFRVSTFDFRFSNFAFRLSLFSLFHLGASHV